MNFARNDTSVIARWWWTVDHWTLVAITILIGVGLVLTLAASPAVADRIGYDPYYFVRHQLLYLGPAIVILVGVSLLSPKDARRIAAVALLFSLVLMMLVPMFGHEIKGARRWIGIGILSLQPSEIAKPALAVVSAWFLSAWRMEERFPGHLLALAVSGFTMMLLLMEPDLGQTVVVVVFTFAEFFVAGIPLALVGIVAGLSAAGLTGAYFVFPHVASRMDRFFDPASGDTYQITTGLEAFMNGGLFGRGPGEGTVKEYLPDAHSDFVFAVAGEEMGFVFCAILVAIFAFIVLRSFGRMMSERNLFVLYAVTGLATQFGLQALIHMSSDMALIPTKGMTLPLISYGGSSLLGIAFGLGLLLALTRRRAGYGET